MNRYPIIVFFNSFSLQRTTCWDITSIRALPDCAIFEAMEQAENKVSSWVSDGVIYCTIKYCLCLSRTYSICFIILFLASFFLQQTTSPQKQNRSKNRSKSTDEVQQAKKVIKSSLTLQTPSICALNSTEYLTSNKNAVFGQIEWDLSRYPVCGQSVKPCLRIISMAVQHHLVCYVKLPLLYVCAYVWKRETTPEHASEISLMFTLINLLPLASGLSHTTEVSSS